MIIINLINSSLKAQVCNETVFRMHTDFSWDVSACRRHIWQKILEQTQTRKEKKHFWQDMRKLFESYGSHPINTLTYLVESFRRTLIYYDVCYFHRKFNFQARIDETRTDVSVVLVNLTLHKVLIDTSSR